MNDGIFSSLWSCMPISTHARSCLCYMISLAGFPDLDDALLGVIILADVLVRLRLPHDHGQLDSLVIQLIVERHIVPGDVGPAR